MYWAGLNSVEPNGAIHQLEIWRIKKQGLAGSALRACRGIPLKISKANSTEQNVE